jgi:hypothetical protein
MARSPELRQDASVMKYLKSVCGSCSSGVGTSEDLPCRIGHKMQQPGSLMAHVISRRLRVMLRPWACGGYEQARRGSSCSILAYY